MVRSENQQLNNLNVNVPCELAVKIRNACKSYQGKNEKVQVLNRLNMTIRRRSIYALMGSSGVGKTALLRIIMAMDTLQSGKIEILGEPIVQSDRRIGYMPQDTALIDNFTVREIINFFGVLYGLSAGKISGRFDFLSQLLELPGRDTLIKKCSGGEKRRVSFASAIVHEPQILILDEPTVGIDPLLREKIWDFLLKLVSTTDSTIIISTHYIQESMKSTCIGLMRKGKILIEEKPQDIIKTFNTTSLEVAFLSLSEEQDRINDCSETETMSAESGFFYHAPKQKFDFSMKRLMALLSRNFIHQKRSKIMFMFLGIFPLFVLISIHIYGKDPQGLKLGIVNDEVDDLESCHRATSLSTAFSNEFTCYVKDVSCRFINELKDTVALKRYYKTLDSATHDVRHGIIGGFIHFSRNFTNILQGKFLREDLERVSSLNFDYGSINVYLDQSNVVLTNFLQRKILETYQTYSEKLMDSCAMAKKMGNIPLNVQALFGTLDDEFQKYISVSFAICCYFFQASALTSTALIGDRVDGIWNRTLMAGTQPLEMIISHILSSTVLMLIQFIQYFLLLVYYFWDNPNSNVLLAGCLFLLVGLCGLIYGLSVSVYADSHSVALFLSTAIFIPICGIAGIIWPIEAVPVYLRYLGYALPFTVPIMALRGLFYKGLTLHDPVVYLAFFILEFWIALSFVLCFVGLSIRKYHKR